MQIEISHSTNYLYSKEVFFEPHYFRLKPKATPHSSVLSFSIDIVSAPKGMSKYKDIENNDIVFCWFEDLHQELKVSAKSVLKVEEFNPFDFLVHPSDYLKVPFIYNDIDKQLLAPYLQTDALSASMKDYLNKIISQTKNQTIDLLTELTKVIHQEYVVESREEGVPNNIQYTFDTKNGSCRDLVWMQIHLLRNTGIAARFVSGYFYIQADNSAFELHAWTEAYLPGAGWVGFDPSHGIMTGSYHVPLAASAFYENTMPVSGSTRGEATSELKYDLDIVVTE